MKDAREFQWCAQRLKALGEADRLRIIDQLLNGEQSVGQLAETLGEALVKVSHHLGVLRQAEIVTTRREGRFIIYGLNPEVFVVAETVGARRQLDFGCCRLDIPVERGRGRTARPAR